MAKSERNTFLRSLVGWGTLWVIGARVVPYPASAMSDVMAKFVASTGLGSLWWAVDAVAIAAWAGTLFAIGWWWAMTGTRKVLERREEAVETLDTRVIPLFAGKRDAWRVNLLAMLPFLVSAALLGFKVDFLLQTGIPGLIPAIGGLVPAVFVLWVARSLRAPSLTITPTSVRLSRPLLPDRRIPLAEVEDLKRDADQDLWLVTRSERIRAGRLPLGIPVSLRRAVESAEGSEGEVDPELERLRRRSGHLEG